MEEDYEKEQLVESEVMQEQKAIEEVEQEEEEMKT